MMGENSLSKKGTTAKSKINRGRFSLILSEAILMVVIKTHPPKLHNCFEAFNKIPLQGRPWRK